MKCNLPKSFNQLPKSEQNAIQEALNEQLGHLVDKEHAEVQEIWIKLACINLHDNFGFDEVQLIQFVAMWNRIYSRNEQLKTKLEQTDWLDAEMTKCFPKYGFPQSRIDKLKEKV